MSADCATATPASSSGRGRRGKGKEEDSQPEVWSAKDQVIQVQEGNGYLYNLRLRAKVDGAPTKVYEILTDPQSVDVFRSIKECTYREILEESPSKKQRKIEVAHKAIARFLFINVTFETRLFVWEDDAERKIRFCNARDGFMKKFEGSWHIQPFNAATAARDGIVPAQRPRFSNPFSALHSRFGMPPEEEASALVTLEQAILPKTPAPPGIKGLIRRLCAKQAYDMMEDLRAEVDRREGRGKAKRNGKKGQKQPAAAAVAAGVGAAAAASMTLSQPWDLWALVEPINITIQL